MKNIFKWIQGLLWVVGVGALGYCAFTYWYERSFQAGQSARLDASIRAGDFGRKVESPKVPNALLSGEVLGRLEIPRLGMKVMVVEGVDEQNLKRGAGHIPGTVMPGEHGNAGVAGHRDTVFRPLRDIRRNDTVQMVTLQGTYTYRVVSTVIVDPSDVAVLGPTGKDTLTLVTCYPFNYIGSAPQRFIIKAEKTS
jgi:sortase A